LAIFGRVPYTSNWEVVKYRFSMGFLYHGMGPFHDWFLVVDSLFKGFYEP
jgi:hypothetical protein